MLRSFLILLIIFVFYSCQKDPEPTIATDIPRGIIWKKYLGGSDDDTPYCRAFPNA